VFPTWHGRWHAPLFRFIFLRSAYGFSFKKLSMVLTIVMHC